uniref:Uncharacterized protein n=1 Tax=Rousettus aegyptiacus TaxID=9407 RepID=A0A7J8GAQ5_ROUAE|nr:hypothetical protein HJG63_011524 [Rousettus aegyptiacus]
MEGKARRGQKEKMKRKTRRDREKKREEEKRKENMGGEERHENVNKKEESEGKGEKEEREMWREKKKKKEEEKRKKRELRGPAYGFLVGPACFRGLFPPSSLLITIITAHLIQVDAFSTTNFCKTVFLMRNAASLGLAFLLSQNSVQGFPSTISRPKSGEWAQAS